MYDSNDTSPASAKLFEQTFVFADLSGFTALTEAHGDEQAADLVGEFSGAVRQLLPERQAHEVKTIGDAPMIRAPDPAAAILLGLSIVHGVGEQHGFPAVRVGMHTGPAIERSGDWFGATVNLAARVSRRRLRERDIADSRHQGWRRP